MSEWWLSRGDGKTEGPVSTQALVDGLVSGQIPNQSQVCRVGEQTWTRISQIDEIWEAANPEQVRTNITERPWFLSSADSGQHSLQAAVESEDERTQLLTPVPIVTPPGAGSRLPFVTPLPRPATHRELFARQNHAASRNASPKALGALPAVDTPMRPKVPTLEGITSESAVPGQSPLDPRGTQGAGHLKATEVPGTRPLLPQLSHQTAAHSPHANGPKVPLASPAIGIAPLGGIPSQGAHATAPLPVGSMPVTGIASLQRAPAALGTPNHAAGHEPSSGHRGKDSPQPNLPTAPPHRGLELSRSDAPVRRSGSASSTERAAQGATPALREPHPAPTAQPKPTGQRAPFPEAQATSARPLHRPPLPGPNPIAPRERTSGQVPAPSVPRQGLRSDEPLPVVSHVAVPMLSRTPESDTQHPSDADELTTVARAPSPYAADAEEQNADDEKTVLATRAAIASGTSTKTVQHAGQSGSEATSIVAKMPAQIPLAIDDDELTSLIATDQSARAGAPEAQASSIIDEDATTIIKAPVAKSPPIGAAEKSAGQANRGTSPTTAESVSARSAKQRSGVSPIQQVAPDALVTDPTQLLEECCDDDSSEQRRPAVAAIVRRPADVATATLPTNAPSLAIVPPSAPPPARRPRFLSAPSIVLNPEPFVHQEATQPAARALRQGNAPRLQLGTVIVSLLALALAALAIAYLYLHRR